MENYNLVNRVKDIMQLVESDPQIIIFSESNNKATQKLSSALLNDPSVIGFDEEAFSQDSSEQKEKPISEAPKEQPENGQDKQTEEEFNLDQEEVNRKLESASVSVVLNPEEKNETEQENSSNGQNSDTDEDPTVPEDLTQAYIYVPPRAKISTLLAHLEKTLTDKIVVFAASKRTTDRLFRIIRKKGWGVVSINEGLKQEYYDERFGKFVSGDMKILLVGGLSATEVELDEVKQVINYDVPSEVEEYKYRAELVGNGKAARMVSLVSKMDKDDIDEIVKKVGYAPTEIPLPEDVKEKKGRSKKSSGSNKNNKKKNNKNDRKDRKDRKRRKPKKEKKTNELPRPTYDGLSGGKEGKGKRPAPSSGEGAFGWIKKLFN
jgi:superfamily II DNA/RNA helicase